MTLDQEIILYQENLNFLDPMPAGLKVMNPFRENKIIETICRRFYEKYYHDEEPRFLILGINPGRLGAGATGLPFTDTKRLVEKCGLPDPGFSTHEPSSAFIYDMIDAFGGPELFYHFFYISSVFPLGFIKKNERGKYVNFNYYDDILLQEIVTPFIVQHITIQLKMCKHTETIFCLGTGKNYRFLDKLNKKYGLCREIIPLEHPRFIMQYRSKTKNDYIRQYLEVFRKYLDI